MDIVMSTIVIAEARAGVREGTVITTIPIGEDGGVTLVAMLQTRTLVMETGIPRPRKDLGGEGGGGGRTKMMAGMILSKI